MRTSINTGVSEAETTVVPMGVADEHYMSQVCELLVHSFRNLSPTWVPTVEAARAKVREALQPG